MIKKKTRKTRANARKNTSPRWKQRFETFLTVLKYGAVAVTMPAVGAGLYFGGDYVMTSGYFTLKNVRVAGNSRVSTEEVMAYAGIELGGSIWELDTKAAEGAVQSHPWIKSVRVRKLPPDELEIHVVERKAHVLVNMDGLYVMDSGGVIFKRLEVSDSLDLPVVTGATRATLETWSDEFQERLLELVSVVKRDKVVGADNISEIHADADYGFSIYTSSGAVRLELGMDDFSEKLGKYGRVKRSFGGSMAGVRSVDLDNERGVVVRFDARGPGSAI